MGARRGDHASAASAQWVVESYGLFLAALILIGGSLGDIFERRTVFGSGIALFALPRRSALARRRSSS